MSYAPEFAITPALLAKAEGIAALRERIARAAAACSGIASLQKDIRARAVHASAALDGNPLALQDVRGLEGGFSLPSEDSRAGEEILDALAGNRSLERIGRKTRLQIDDIQDLHRTFAAHGKAPQEAGHWRAIALRMGRYLPPPPHIPVLLGEFLDWWNRDGGKLPPLLSSAILHYRLEAIHPFAEANGRVSRALAAMELQRRGFDPHRLLAVEEILREDGAGYSRQLDAVQKAAENLTGWLEYWADAVERAADRAWMRIQSQDAGSGPALALRPRQEELLRMLRDLGSLTPREIWEGLGVSRQGAMNLLNPLLEAGLLERLGGRKTGRYDLRSKGST